MCCRRQFVFLVLTSEIHLCAGYAPARNDFLFERRLQNFIFDVLMQHARGKSALVFCSTRKGAQEAAQSLSQTVMNLGHSNPFIKFKEQQDRLKEASLSFSDKQMQSCIIYGVGYHNGGLCLKDRNFIESLFLKGDLQILCTTNTLAHGINLPAHTVVIKSTQYFNKEKGVYTEYDRSMILQMSGRAGRPPFEDTGTVIIMTRKETVHLYENLLNGCEMVESQLLSCTTEHLNAEIVQLTVSDITLAIEWLKCSYLYVRIKKNPEYYGVKKGIPSERLEKHMQEICVQKVNELSSFGMIWTDEYGFLLKPLEPGQLMTTYYLKFDTMKGIIKTPENCNLEDVLRTICCSEEIAWIQLRRNEKKLLNDINSDKDGRLRFHVLSENGKQKKRIQMREEKIFVLVNDCFTGDPSIHDLSFSQDINSICSNGCRIARCMKEYFIYRKSYKGALNSSLLAKSLHQRLWDDSPYLLKQLPGIGMVTAKALHLAGINSFKTMEEADPRRIEIITGRKYPFGNHIKDSLLSLPPKIEVKIEEAECRRQGRSKIVITLSRLSQSVSSLKRHYADMFVGSEEDNLILFHEKIRAEEFSSPYSATFLLSNPQRGKLTVKADLIFEEYVGLDIHEMLIITKGSNSRMSGVHGDGQAASTYSLPKEIYVVKDDENDTVSLAPSEAHLTKRKSKRGVSSIPSFNLLQDDDLDEEGATPVNNEECKSEIVTKDTIFSHIRKKSKSFPVIVTSPKLDFSPSRALILTEKMDMDEIHREILMLPNSDPAETSSDLTTSRICSRKMDEYGYSINEVVTPKSIIFGSPSSNGKSELSIDILIGGTDWMETKSPVSHIFSASGGQRFLPLKEQTTESKEFNGDAGVQLENAALGQSGFSTKVSSNVNDKTVREKLSSGIIIIEDDVMADSEMQVENAAQKQLWVPESSRSVEKFELSFESSSAAIVQTKTKMPFLDILVEKAYAQETVWHRALKLNEQQPTSKEWDVPSKWGFDKQPCSSATLGREKEVSFLGFKSVFSFL
eukprot:TRINITY_DN4480_c0_g1_i11.p1 TRINITY_DN4480_c0_g1~~TRINITY_DN4480_c0_g1_i11.p1  ORF type:complete len:1021 (+),score=205.13 TRINITY_DN4480_c0_g1_i11:1226-4288(+)